MGEAQSFGKRVHLELQSSTKHHKIRQLYPRRDFNVYTPTEAIINFVYEDNSYGKDGILDIAGETVKQEYNVNRLKNDCNVKLGVVVTDAGNLPSQFIFHVTVFPHPAKFKAALHHSLRLADRRGLRSISVPALPTNSQAGKKLIDQYLQVFL